MIPGLLLDDVVDSSTHRRGIPCWYTLDNNIQSVHFDVCKLNLLTFRLFNKYYQHRLFHRNISELFYEVNLHTST